MSWVSNRWAVQAEVQRLPVVGPRRQASEYRLQTSDATYAGGASRSKDVTFAKDWNPQARSLIIAEEKKQSAFWRLQPSCSRKGEG